MSQTFPKRIYTIQDAAMDMKEAGFLPNVTLIVNIAGPVIEGGALEGTRDKPHTFGDNQEMDSDSSMEESQSEDGSDEIVSL